MHQILVEPLAVWLSCGIITLALFIGYNTLFRRIHKQHFTRLQAAFFNNMLRRNIKHAYFGGQNKRIVIGYIVARGTQPVSVKHRAYGIAIRKKYGCGAVPRLHHCRVIVIKISFGSGYGLAVAPRLGDSNHYCKRQIHSVHNKEFKCVIEHCRV